MVLPFCNEKGPSDGQTPLVPLNHITFNGTFLLSLSTFRNIKLGDPCQNLDPIFMLVVP